MRNPLIRIRLHAALPTLGLALCAALSAGADTDFRNLTPQQQLSEDMLREAIAFETTKARAEQNLLAMQAVADRLLAAGFDEGDIQIVNPYPGTWGLVVRYRGSGASGLGAIGVAAHMDVVPATPDAWAFPPFTLGTRDGYYLGRGTIDNKAGVVQIFANFIRLKQEGWVPGRDIIAAITGDEETDGKMAAWFASEGRELVDVDYVLNTDAGGGEYDADRTPIAFWVQTSEKVYQTWELSASNEGGHSSLPRPDNAIADLALAITRLVENPMPVSISDSMRAGLQRAAGLYPEPVRSDMLALAENPDDTEAAARLTAMSPALNAVLRTTCTPTMLRGGHAENALPRDAVVTVNCRILPGTPVSEVEQYIAGLMDGLDITINSVYDAVPSPPSEMPPAFQEQLETLVEQRWGEVPVVPMMSMGATDGLFYRNAGTPVYGVAAVFQMPDEDRAHGLDEKIGIAEFHDSVDFWYDLFKAVGE